MRGNDIAESNEFDRAAYGLLRKARDTRVIQDIAYDWLVENRNQCSDKAIIASIALMVKCVSEGKVRVV